MNSGEPCGVRERERGLYILPNESAHVDRSDAIIVSHPHTCAYDQDLGVVGVPVVGGGAIGDDGFHERSVGVVIWQRHRGDGRAMLSLTDTHGSQQSPGPWREVIGQLELLYGGRRANGTGGGRWMLHVADLDWKKASQDWRNKLCVHQRCMADGRCGMWRLDGSGESSSSK